MNRSVVLKCLVLILAAAVVAAVLLYKSHESIVGVSAQLGQGADEFSFSAQESLTVQRGADGEYVLRSGDVVAGAEVVSITARYEGGNHRVAYFESSWSEDGKVEYERSWGDPGISLTPQRNGGRVSVVVDRPDYLTPLLGILGLVQAVFLPGFILIKLFRFDRYGGLTTMLLSFAASLPINTYLAFGLVFLKSYDQMTMLTIVLVELAALAGITVFYSGSDSVKASFSEQLYGAMAANSGRRSVGWKVVWYCSAGIAAVALGYILYNTYQTTGSVFLGWDSRLSWNRWAVNLASGIMPQGAYDYPQLIPAVWSIPYAFMGDMLEAFPKGLVPLFHLAIFCIFFDLFCKTRNPLNLLSAALTLFLMECLLEGRAWQGFVDVPIATTGFVALYAILLAQKIPGRREAERVLLLGALFAGASALTKQAGLYMLIAYPLLAYFFVLKDRPGAPWSQKGILAKICLLSVAVPSFWYGHRLYLRIFHGYYPTKFVKLTTVLHAGRGPLERLVHAVSFIRNLIGTGALAALFGSVPLLGVMARGSRPVALIVVIPFFFLWALLFSYDARNFMFAIPFLTVTIPLALRPDREPEKRVEAASDFRGRGVVWSLAVAVCVAGAFLLPPKSELLHSQTLQHMDSIRPKVHGLLYDAYRNGELDGDVLARGDVLSFLPIFTERSIKVDLGDFSAFLAAADEKHAAAVFYNTNDPRNAPVHKYVKERIRSGEYAVSGRMDGYLLVLIK